MIGRLAADTQKRDFRSPNARAIGRITNQPSRHVREGS
jgi:hypothetical protein